MIELRELLEFAGRYRYWWEQSGKPVAEVADDCGVTPKTVYDWLKGSSMPRNQIRAVAALGVTMPKFWGADVPLRLENSHG